MGIVCVFDFVKSSPSGVEGFTVEEPRPNVDEVASGVGERPERTGWLMAVVGIGGSLKSIMSTSLSSSSIVERPVATTLLIASGVGAP